ncbi:Ankyrin repeats domain-containing protein [Phytophthora infestans]|uniref:Ankyrin repeats domain-containing protein n=1 Tax=Phytophthora infestans TaxID=4787 RepID=A0A8S9UQS1_PHYIN|nr:Ankyrin repeats domain-containing protein [Phytophthora infestans]
MLTYMEFVLRRYPEVESFEHSTKAISRFLGPPPSLSLAEVCGSGTLAMLDWIWSASCTQVEDRTRRWSLTNYLRSDPHYHRWEFVQSLSAAAERGDLSIVKWIFAHFSNCEAPAEEVRAAGLQGYLHVLAFLWEHRSGNDRASRSGQATISAESVPQKCTVNFGDGLGGLCWGHTVISKAIENGLLAQCVEEGMELNSYDRVIAIKHALQLGDVELARRLLPVGRCIINYAADVGRPEMIQIMLDRGLLQWDEKRSATAFGHLGGYGNSELMQQILQLHSPLRQDIDPWKKAWSRALEAACSKGDLCVLRWLVEHPLIKDTSAESRNYNSQKILYMAAKDGHVRVMQYLYDQGLATDIIHFCHAGEFVLDSVALNSVKWLAENDMIGDQHRYSCAIAQAALAGRLDILQLFQTLDTAGGYEAVGLKRRRTDQTFSLWGGYRDTFYWAARGGHVHVLEWLQKNYPAKCGQDAMDAAISYGHIEAVKWLHANRTEGCTSGAMYSSACNGHFEMVKWLYLNRPESHTPEAMVKANTKRSFTNCVLACQEVSEVQDQ